LGERSQAAELLLGLAQSEGVHDWVRRAAARGVGQLGVRSQAVFAGLVGLAQSEGVHDLVRRDAYESLKKILGVSL
jgi:hypothetical protein